MEKKDYYEILGISRNATEQDMKKAFRKLALQWHPDRNKNPEAEENFKEINEAYAVLGNPEKRTQYDLYGRERLGGSTARDLFQEIDFESFFKKVLIRESLGRSPRAPPQRGSDIEVHLEITLEEAAHGEEKTFFFEKKEPCDACRSSGAEKTKACKLCQGTGREPKKYLLGNRIVIVSSEYPCSQCRGRGNIIHTQCKKCKGIGFHSLSKRFTARIPKGIGDGAHIPIREQGNPGQPGQRAGDLYILIEIAPHPIFKRQGDDLVMERQISFAQAALGAEIEIRDIYGKKYMLKIPEGTGHGIAFILKGKGMPRLHESSCGNLNVVIKIFVPTKLTKKQKRIWEELKDQFKNAP